MEVVISFIDFLYKYNIWIIVILVVFMIVLVPLTMIGRIIAYKHFWTDVCTALIMSIFILGVCNILTIKY